MTKRTINVGTIGHVDHGKTTTTAALGTYFNMNKGEKFDIDNIDNHKEEKARGITINTRSIRYETPGSIVNHTDCPGHADFIKNMITGAAQLDCALLVVSAFDGPQEQTKEHIKIASATKIPNIIVILNKMDMIPPSDIELVELAKDEILDLLEKNGFKRSEVKFAELSATRALEESHGAAPESQYGIGGLKKIGEEIDAAPLDDNSEKDAMPFCMIVEDIYSIQGRGTVVAGKVASGVLTRAKDLKLEIVKKNNQRVTVDVTDMQVFHTPVDKISTGSNAALLVRGLERSDVSRGDIVVAPGAFQAFHFAKVQLYFFDASEGGRKSRVESLVRYTPHIFIGARDTPAVIIKTEGGVESVEPGQTVVCWMAFYASMIQDPDNKSIIVRESSNTIGLGVILEATNVPPITLTQALVKKSAILERIVKSLRLKVEQ